MVFIVIKYKILLIVYYVCRIGDLTESNIPKKRVCLENPSQSSDVKLQYLKNELQKNKKIILSLKRQVRQHKNNKLKMKNRLQQLHKQFKLQSKKIKLLPVSVN